MGKIFKAPSTIKKAELNFSKDNDYQADSERYVKEVQDFCKRRNPNGEHVGEVIKFQVADGYAGYVVASLKPVELVHLEIMDEYQFPYAERLTKKDIIDEINKLARLKKLFGS